MASNYPEILYSKDYDGGALHNVWQAKQIHVSNQLFQVRPLVSSEWDRQYSTMVALKFAYYTWTPQTLIMKEIIIFRSQYCSNSLLSLFTYGYRWTGRNISCWELVLTHVSSCLVVCLFSECNSIFLYNRREFHGVLMKTFFCQKQPGAEGYAQSPCDKRCQVCTTYQTERFHGIRSRNSAGTRFFSCSFSFFSCFGSR